MKKEIKLQYTPERYRNLSEEENDKKVNMDVHGIKISMEIKNKVWLSTEKSTLKNGKQGFTMITTCNFFYYYCLQHRHMFFDCKTYVYAS